MRIFKKLVSRVLLSTFIFFLTPQPSMAQAKSQDVVDFDHLLAQVKSQNASSVEDFISLLPPSYKKDPILMIQSHSAQTGTQDHPRVILVGNTAIDDTVFPGANPDHLYIAFQTDTSANSKKPNTVEMIEWHYKQRQYTFHSIKFRGKTGDTSSAPYTLPETKSCLGCHGHPGRPNWTGYPDWPGAMANHQRFYANLNQPYYTRITRDDVIKFVDNLKAKNPRLQGLDFSGYSDADDGFLPSDNPLLRMTSKVGSQLVLRDIPLLAQTPDFAKYKYALAGAFLNCTNFKDFFPPDVLSSMKAKALESLKTDPIPADKLPATADDLTMEKMWSLTAPFVQESTHFGGYPQEVTVTSWLRFIFQGRGLGSTFTNILGIPPYVPGYTTFDLDFAGIDKRLSDGLGYQFFREMKHDKDIGDFYQLDYRVQSAFVTKKEDASQLIASPCSGLAQKSYTSLLSN